MSFADLLTIISFILFFFLSPYQCIRADALISTRTEEQIYATEDFPSSSGMEEHR